MPATGHGNRTDDAGKGLDPSAPRQQRDGNGETVKTVPYIFLSFVRLPRRRAKGDARHERRPTKDLVAYLQVNIS